MRKPILRRSFNGGEVAPTVWQREDVKAVQTGCRVMKNFMVHPHGAAVRRRGFVRWADVTSNVLVTKTETDTETETETNTETETGTTEES